MERERLTITLRGDILKLVDQSIDGAKLRNRSHAIEYFLSQQLSPKTAKVALVLNPGFRPTYQTGYQTGLRLRGEAEGSDSRRDIGIGVRAGGKMTPPTDLKAIFKILSEQGFTELLLVGDDATALQAAAIDAEKQEIDAKTATIDTQGQPAETAFDKLKANLDSETFIYWDGRFSGGIDLAAFLDFHKNSRAQATAALMQTTAGVSSPVGLVGQLLGNKLTSIIPVPQTGIAGLPLAGLFVFEPSVLAEATEHVRNLYKDILPALSSEGNLAGFAFVKEEARQTVPVTR